MDPCSGSRNSQGRPTEPIYEAAVSCLAIFDEYLRQRKVPEQPSKQDAEGLYLEVEELRARFKQWAAYIGAFASSRASLDARLALRKTTQDMVLELLVLIRLNMRWVIVRSDLKDKDKSWKTTPTEASPTYKVVYDEMMQQDLGNIQSSYTKNKHSDIGDPDLPGLGAVAAAVNRLFVLAVDIRRSARESHKIRPGVWNEQSPSLSTLLRIRHPYARSSLLTQLAISIHTRGVSLRYLQIHNEKLAFDRNRTTNISKPEQNSTRAANPQASDPSMPSVPLMVLGTSHHIIDAVSTPDTTPSAFSQTNIDRYRARQKRSDSIISRGSAVGGDTAIEDQYPPIPTGKEKCSICADPLDLSKMTENDWKLHVNKDLEPYLCISEDCIDPPKFFSSSTEWMDHMQTRHTMDWAQKVHTEQWYCHLCAEVEFDNKPALLTHLQSQHGHKLTASQIQGRARRNRRIARREDVFACPFCDCVPDSILPHLPEKPYKRLAKHVGRHLKSLSFLSLSYLDVDYGRNEEITDHSKTKAVDGDEEGTDASRCSRRDALADEEFWDIPKTITVENGRRMVIHALINNLKETVESFEDEPPPLEYNEDWHFWQPPSLQIDFSALIGFAHSENLDPDDEIQVSYAGKAFLVPELQERTPQPFALIPFRRDANFIPRGDILIQIHRGCMYPPRRVALVGLGGVGKSQLAIEFAYQASERATRSWVFWVNAGTRTRVEESFRTIADAINLAGRNDPKADILELVYNWLSDEKNGRWVMILDGADYDGVLFGTNKGMRMRQPLETYLPQSRNGSILITSRNISLVTKLTETSQDRIWVQPMTEVEALTLLRSKLGSIADMDMDSMYDLVRVLGFFPLAISQAAAYIQARVPRYSIKRYLDEFLKSEQEQTSLLSHESGEPGSTLNSLLTTWQISFEYIRSQRPSATNLLALMSFFDRHGIPKWVLKPIKLVEDASNSDNGPHSNLHTDAKEVTDDDFEEDISTLKSFGLIAANKNDDEVEMNGLVQLSMRNWLKVSKQQDNFKQQYLERIATAFPTGEYENWATCQSLFAHVENALECQPSGSGWKECAILLHNGGSYAWSQGRYDTADQMVGEALQTRLEMLGKEDASTLASMSLLATVIQGQGRWNEAEKLEVQVMEISMIKLGPDHPDTLRSQNNLASIYRNQGRWEEAEKLGVHVVEICKLKLGVDHPSTLTSMTNLSMIFWNQGRWEEAEKLEIEVMKTSKAKLGVDHPDTLSSMANLALTYSEQGRWEEAEKLEIEVLETRQIQLGVDHPDTLSSMANLASTYSQQGRWEEAEKLDMQVLETRKIKLGVDHPDTLSSMANLASTYSQQGRWEEAERLEVEVLETRKTKLGVNHPNTLTSMANLASTYSQQGRWEEAERLEVKVLETRQIKIGVEHPDTLASMNNLAITWKKQGRDDEALMLMESCTQAQCRVLGVEHPHTITSISTVESWRD